MLYIYVLKLTSTPTCLSLSSQGFSNPVHKQVCNLYVQHKLTDLQFEEHKKTHEFTKIIFRNQLKAKWWNHLSSSLSELTPEG